MLQSALLYTSLDLVFQPHHEPNRETTSYTTEQGCNVGLAVTYILSGPLSKIRVLKIKVAALPDSFSSS